MPCQSVLESPVRLRSEPARKIMCDARIMGWLQLVRGEYLEIPGLHLTRSQVRRLWGLDEATCDAVINSLVDTGFLRQTAANAYVRAGAPRCAA